MNPSRFGAGRSHSVPVYAGRWDRGFVGSPLEGVIAGCFVLITPARTAPLAFPSSFFILAPVSVSVTELTDKLLASYAQVGGINHLDGKNLPSKSRIAAITVDFLRLLFPGFFDDQQFHSSELKIETATLVDSVLDRLLGEVEKSLEYAPPDGVKPGEIAKLARDETHRLIGALPGVRELLQTDVDAAFNGDPAALSREEVIVSYPFIETIAVQRLAHQLYLNHVPLIPRIMTEWAHSRTGMDLHPGAQIGTHFFIDHGTGTVIGESSVIGNHVKMYQCVSLIGRSLAGGQALRGKRRHPTIEDHVTLYAGATIMGGDTVVGAHSTVGANVFLTHSVPPHSLVISEELKVKVMDKLAHKASTVDFQI